MIRVNQQYRFRGWRQSAGVGLLVAVVLFPSCERAQQKQPPEAASVEAGKRTANFELMKKVSALSDGAHVRLVWVEHRTRQEFDPFGEQTDYRLVGFDNREVGFRVLARKRDNYSRPLFTPDGSAVVFTERRWLERRSEERPAEPADRASASLIKILPWRGGGGLKELGQGLALSVWRDSSTGEDWVYFIDDNRQSSRQRSMAQAVYRFPLRDPSKREVAWQGTAMRADSFHISRDGCVFAALFPWPEAGIGDFAAKKWRKLDLGCWPAVAPDNSRLAWVFDGGHKRLRLFDATFRHIGRLDLHDAPGMNGYPAFHPKWSNHPRFIVMTGPYISKAKGRSALEGGAGHAEVHLGKLKPDCSGFDGWVTVTSNSSGDFFPDAWVEGGQEALLGNFPQQTNKPLPLPKIKPWPLVSKGVEFAWSDAKAENKIVDRNTNCSLEARGIARAGRHFDLLLDGGWFEADAEACAAWAKAVNASAKFFIQMMVAEKGHGTIPAAGVPLLAAGTPGDAPSFAVIRTPGGLRAELRLRGQAELWKDEVSTDAIASERPRILALVWQDQRLHWFADGRALHSSDLAPAELPVFPDSLVWSIGSTAVQWPARWWCGGKIILASEARTPGLVAAEAEVARAAIAGRAEVTPLRIEARLVAATPPEPERLEVYKRMLVDHTYDVVRSVEGQGPVSKRIVVLHWAILDEKLVTGLPRGAGDKVELLIEPASVHPEIESELTITGQSDFSLPLYYDVAPAKSL
ncbi:MAG: hypothetical protein ACR2OZ_12870 [Verrucomicrobiales bacterium]